MTNVIVRGPPPPRVTSLAVSSTHHWLGISQVEGRSEAGGRESAEVEEQGDDKSRSMRMWPEKMHVFCATESVLSKKLFYFQIVY